MATKLYSVKRHNQAMIEILEEGDGALPPEGITGLIAFNKAENEIAESIKNEFTSRFYELAYKAFVGYVGEIHTGSGELVDAYITNRLMKKHPDAHRLFSATAGIKRDINNELSTIFDMSQNKAHIETVNMPGYEGIDLLPMIVFNESSNATVTTALPDGTGTLPVTIIIAMSVFRKEPTSYIFSAVGSEYFNMRLYGTELRLNLFDTKQYNVMDGFLVDGRVNMLIALRLDNGTAKIKIKEQYEDAVEKEFTYTPTDIVTQDVWLGTDKDGATQSDQGYYVIHFDHSLMSDVDVDDAFDKLLELLDYETEFTPLEGVIWDQSQSNPALTTSLIRVPARGVRWDQALSDPALTIITE